MAFPNDRTYSFDANLVLSDNAAAYTANGFAQAGGANAILDLGGNQGVTPTQLARIDAVAVVDVTAIDIASGNETYKLVIVGSNSPSLASNCVELGGIQIGKGASLEIANGQDNVTGRYEIGFCNQVAGALFQYIALAIVVAGTTPSINIEAFVAVEPEP